MSDNGGWGLGPAPRCVVCGDRATALVTLSERPSARAGHCVEDAERYAFSYRLCDRCRDEVAPDELAASALPDEDEYGWSA